MEVCCQMMMFHHLCKIWLLWSVVWCCLGCGLLPNLSARLIHVHWQLPFLLRVSMTISITAFVWKSKQHWLHSKLGPVQVMFVVCVIFFWQMFGEVASRQLFFNQFQACWCAEFFSVCEHNCGVVARDFLILKVFFEIRSLNLCFWHVVCFVVIWDSCDPHAASFWESQSEVGGRHC